MPRAARRKGGEGGALERKPAEPRTPPNPQDAFRLDPALLCNDALAVGPLHHGLPFGSRTFDAAA